MRRSAIAVCVCVCMTVVAAAGPTSADATPSDPSPSSSAGAATNAPPPGSSDQPSAGSPSVHPLSTTYSLPVSSSSNPNGQFDLTVSTYLESWQSTYCVEVNGTAGGRAHANETLWFNLFTPLYGDPGLGWVSQNRSPAYFGLDGKNHYWCWQDVPAGYISPGDTYIRYTYAVAWETLNGPNYGAVHVNYTLYSPQTCGSSCPAVSSPAPQTDTVSSER